MDAGQLNQLLHLQRPVDGQDTIGQPAQSWQNVRDEWADVRFPGGLEAVRGGAETATTRASVRIRYRADVTTAMRFVHDGLGLTLQIKAVLPDLQRREFLDLVCEVVE